MHEKLIEVFTNPIKAKIYHEVMEQKQVTAKQVAGRHPDIPQATLYRYLKKMEADGILVVAQERKVRNVIEKIYEVAPTVEADFEQMLEANPEEGVKLVIQQTMLGLLQEFGEYFRKGDTDVVNDGLGVNVTPFYASQAEVEEMFEKLLEVIKPYYEQEAAPDRKLRNLALVLTPPKK
jgi:DNA-binding PadR family transcriptional regulator